MHTADHSKPGPLAGSLEPSDDALPVIPLDMDAIYQTATAARRWRLEYDCDGAQFVALVTAKSFACADLIARRELADTCAGFERFGARLVASEQTP